MASDIMADEEIDERLALVAGLLELAQPGTMLRIVYSRDGERLHVAFEGADHRPGGPCLKEQLQVALESLRSRGMLFGSNDLGTAPQHPRKNRSFELVPRRRTLALTPAAGFDRLAKDVDDSNSVIVPDIPSARAARWLTFAPLLLLQDDALRSAEVEFSVRKLHAEEIVILRAVFDGQMRKHALVFGEKDQPGALETFLGLWLQNERGWTVRCRVYTDPGFASPEALLEVFGSEVFGVESQLQAEERVPGGVLDLSSAFPPGWPFPSLLPTPDDFLRLAAHKMINRSLPVLPKDGLSLGTIEGRTLRLPSKMRDRHTYIFGATGTGKSTLKLQLILQDSLAGRGVGVIDTDDLCRDVLAALPRSRVKDTFYLDLGDEKHLPGVNLLQVSQGPLHVFERNLVVNEVFGIFDQLFDMSHAGGPMFEMYFRNALLLMMESGILDLTLAEFPMVFAHDKFRRRLVANCSDPCVKDFWQGIAHRAGGDSSLANIAPYIVSKLTPLLNSPVVRAVIGQSTSQIDFRKLMDGKGILLIRLPKGLLGDLDTRLLGMFFISKIFTTALGRASIPLNRRHRFHLYIDEFQNFVTPSMARLLPEARKFGLCLTLANQNLAQLHGSSRSGGGLLESVLGNVGNLILFRLGVFDAEQLEPYAKPQLNAQDLQRLPNFHAFARLLDIEGPVEPLVFATESWSSGAKKGAQKQVMARRKLWGSPRTKVETQIRARRERLLAQAERSDTNT